MASFKTCDYCKRPEPQVQFGANASYGPISTDVQFVDPTQKRHNIMVSVMVDEPGVDSSAGADICDECRVKIVDAGLADILAQRQNAARGVFIAGAAAKIGNGPR